MVEHSSFIFLLSVKLYLNTIGLLEQTDVRNLSKEIEFKAISLRRLNKVRLRCVNLNNKCKTWKHYFSKNYYYHAPKHTKENAFRIFFEAQNLKHL